MATPQVKNGYLQFANELVDAFFRLHLSGNQWQLLWVIIRATYGWNTKNSSISLTTFQKLTGIERRNLKKGLDALVERNIVTKSCRGNAIFYSVQKDYEKWTNYTGVKNNTSVKNDTISSVKNNTGTSVKNNTPYKNIKTIKDMYAKFLSDQFKIFYGNYPKKVAKREAEKAWHQLWEDSKSDYYVSQLNNETMNVIMAAINKQKLQSAWQDKNFIPHPATWLRNRRWEDEVDEPVKERNQVVL